ncbi:MAG TPA: nitroreductase/quinone reductase family protein [Acidimicrobiales bacterium]|nr:nitroreductase/quinone reductase family protein [Acidimicrobiales bacterium]HJM30959.1 nitroreductase/quinone reductase family protein [Acidimicrobiales bacterium]
MPSDGFLKMMNRVHRGLLKVSAGKVGWTAARMPVLELTTIGRRSGEPRSVLLTSPHREGETIVVVASKGGEDTHPAWFLNLRENPEVVVSMQNAPAQKMTARVAPPEERERLWPIVTGNAANYANYQNKTQREIPLVVLEPADEARPPG